MLRDLRVSIERWPLATPFRIARGVRTEAEVVVVELHEQGLVGRGEGVPIARYVDTAEDCVAQIEAARAVIEAGLSRQGLLATMKPGAARNAVDCALWDLEGRRAGARGGGSAVRSVRTALTVGLATPQEMEAAARRVAHLPLLKMKANADDPASQIRAVRRGAPSAVLIVDCNESWSMDVLIAMQPVLRECRIALLEQPLHASADADLEGFAPSVPICADEACHTEDDLPRLAGRYQAVNIKLDKTGGLTAALDLLAAARGRGFGVMTGCMICTSLSIAPAFRIAEASDYADLDGPTWLANDRFGGARFENGKVTPPSAALWAGLAVRRSRARR